MPTVLVSSAPIDQIPYLENGDQLTATEFLRRFEAMPDLKKADLINGTVYMASPVRTDHHGEPDQAIQGWLYNYCLATPSVKAATNSTVRLSSDDVPQPDAFLRIIPESGGQARLDKKGYLRGAPELVVEIAASSASLDARQKLHMYRRAGVREYLVWRTLEHALDWWTLEEDEYVALLPDDQGIVRSHVFPGLWLNVPALLAGENSEVNSALQRGVASDEHAAFVKQLKSASIL